MSAAEREAERRWPGIGRGAERAALDRAMRGGFEGGAAWQAERDAVRIAALEAEVEQWRRVAVEQTRLERDRAEAAEAKLAAVRAYCVENTEGMPDDPFAYGIQELRRVLALLDGGDET